jgi:hypothetical protein
MITNFCDFCQFSAKKLAFFLKNQRYDQNFAETSSKLRKNANFSAKFLGENFFKIITSAQIGRNLAIWVAIKFGLLLSQKVCTYVPMKMYMGM